jgi:hypothetical protein
MLYVCVATRVATFAQNLKNLMHEMKNLQDMKNGE